MRLKPKMKLLIMLGIFSIILTACTNSDENALASLSVGSEVIQEQRASIEEDAENGDLRDQEREDMIQEIHLLVAIDCSGSMKPSDTVISEAIQTIVELIEKESIISSVDYLVFNAQKAEFVSYEEVLTVQCEGETSIYKGIEQMNAWVEQEVQNNQLQGISTGMLLFSDLFSSRDKEGKCFTLDTAEQEQKEISEWIGTWKNLIEQEILNVRFIQWESMAEGESSEMTLDSLNDNRNVQNGFQVQIDGMDRYRLFLGEIRSDNMTSQLEQQVVSDCVCEVLKVITGLEDLEWREAGDISKWNNPKDIKIPNSYQLFIRIDYPPENGDDVYIIKDKDKENVFAFQLLKGTASNIYLVENIEKQRINIGSEKLGSKIYYLFIPQISFSVTFSRSNRVTTNEEIRMRLQANCGEGDIRWGVLEPSKTIILEIVDEQSEKCILEKQFSYTEEAMVFTCSQEGNVKIKVHYLDIQGEKQLIKEVSMNVIKSE